MKVKHCLKNVEGDSLPEDAFGKAILGGIRDELGLECGLNSQEAQDGVIAFYRELTECGKPQFVFSLKVKQSSEQVKENFKIVQKKAFLKKINVKQLILYRRCLNNAINVNM